MTRMIAVILSLGALASPALAGDPAVTCQASKNKEAAKYSSCRSKAEVSLVIKGDTQAYAAALDKCATKYEAKWPAIEAKGGGSCPSSGDQTVIQAAIDLHTTNVASALAGGSLAYCAGDLATCESDLGTCTADLATCEATPQGQSLKSGQTTCYSAAGALIPCAATRQDGDLQNGLDHGFVDNGDGTITDTTTGLMWESLNWDSASVHYFLAFYTWADAFAVKIAALNAGAGFAGYTDWRLPNVNELHSLMNYGTSPTMVYPAFSTGCMPGCTHATCSCTLTNPYWSSTSNVGSANQAWTVIFTTSSSSTIESFPKTPNMQSVRAVRGGS